MKTLILSLVALLGLTLAGMVTSSTPVVAAPVVAAPVGNGNPYIGVTPGSFSMPTINCPPNGNYYVDIACAQACYDKYAQRMYEIYNGAAHVYNQSDYRRILANLEVDNALSVCLNAAPTPAQAQACINAANIQYQQIQAEHDSRVADLAASVAADTAAALADFQACAAECCRKD